MANNFEIAPQAEAFAAGSSPHDQIMNDAWGPNATVAHHVTSAELPQGIPSNNVLMAGLEDGVGGTGAGGAIADIAIYWYNYYRMTHPKG
ncbi:MAG: hypothetical protein C0507_00480 [Cyanobacteria bacterium PR.3.49]|jgi:hypothetical protein|nr:hypothetical protein [Cyanobacteria bacterium PR.3.49]